MSTSIYVFEGSWNKPNEAPQVLPYLQAYEKTFKRAHIHHRTFRNGDDLGYYLSKIPARHRAFVYVACHGHSDYLNPSNRSGRINYKDLIGLLENVKQDSIGFLHLGCCDFLNSTFRRARLAAILNAMPGAVFVSGYTKYVSWLPSMLLDMAFIDNVYVPWHKRPADSHYAKVQTSQFVQDYQSLLRSLRFSALSGLAKPQTLIPTRLK